MGELSERERREIAVNTFATDLERARDAWMIHRVLPYVRCYGTAFAWYSHILRKVDRRVALEHAVYVELFTAVALIVGPAMLGFAPVAAIIKGVSNRSHQLANWLSNRARSLGIADQEKAEKALEAFMLGTPGASKIIYTSPVKDYLKRNVQSTTQAMQFTDNQRAFVGAGPPGATPETAIQRAWLEQTFMEIPAQLLACAISLRDNPQPPVDTIEGLRAELDGLRQSQFMATAANLQAYSAAQLTQVRTEMEKALWACWLIANINRVETPVTGYAAGYAAAALSQGGIQYTPGTIVTYTRVPDEVFGRMSELQIQLRMPTAPNPEMAALKLRHKENYADLLLEWAQSFIRTAPLQLASASR